MSVLLVNDRLHHFGPNRLLLWSDCHQSDEETRPWRQAGVRFGRYWQLFNFQWLA